MNPWAAYASAAVPVCGFGWSARATVLDPQLRPNRTSWLLWTALPVILFAFGRSHGVSLRAGLITLALGAGAGLVLAATFANPGTWRPGRFDLACAGCAAGAVTAWALARGAVVPWLAVAGDACAALPTIRAARPGRESRVTYACSGLGAAIALAATWGHWTLAGSLFPGYAVAVCAIITVLLTLPRPTRFRGLTAQITRS